MSYLRCTGTGLLAALLAAVLWVLWAFALPILVAVIPSGAAGAGAGSVTVFLDSNALLAAAAVGFPIGFYWRWRRLRRRLP